jgi:hypothetical protein
MLLLANLAEILKAVDTAWPHIFLEGRSMAVTADLPRVCRRPRPLVHRLGQNPEEE